MFSLVFISSGLYFRSQAILGHCQRPQYLDLEKLKLIQSVIKRIKPNAKDISTETKTLIETYINQKISNFYNELKHNTELSLQLHNNVEQQIKLLKMENLPRREIIID